MGCDDAPCIGKYVLQMLLLMYEQVSRTTAHENLDSTHSIHTLNALQITDIVLGRTYEEAMMGDGFRRSKRDLPLQSVAVYRIGTVIRHVKE